MNAAYAIGVFKLYDLYSQFIYSFFDMAGLVVVIYVDFVH
jgi:hypothetical protein